MTMQPCSDSLSVDETRAVSPLAKVQWPAVVAGAFTALAVFVVSAILARACGVWWTYGTAYTTGEEIGAVIWGGVAALIAFWLGGMAAIRLSVRGSRFANGFMVWAVAVPAMVLVMGAGFGPMLGRSSELPAQRIYGTTEAVEGNPPVATSRGHAQAAAWWALVSLACGLIGVLAASGTTPQGALRSLRPRVA